MTPVSLGSPGEPVPPKLLCSAPYLVRGLMPARCGQCMSCRIARKRAVVLRASLERAQHADACCATLTYSDEFVGDYQVRPADWWHARDRLRHQVERDLGVKPRFFGIGEYGDQKGRPHWHVIAYGLRLVDGEEYFQRAWSDPLSGQPLGGVRVGPGDLAAAEYTAGYTLKKLTVRGDKLLEGRSPEFVIRPNNPGLGLSFIAQIAEAILADPAVHAAIVASGDIPAQLRVGGSLQGIDKYMRNQLRDIVLGEGGAELAREARKANYVAECVAGRNEYGRLWSMGGPSSDAQGIRNRVGKFKIYASANAKVL